MVKWPGHSSLACRLAVGAFLPVSAANWRGSPARVPLEPSDAAGAGEVWSDLATGDFSADRLLGL